MERDLWFDIREKLGFFPACKPALVGMAALLILVAAFAGRTIFEAATANDFQVVRAQEQQQAGDGQDAAATLFVHVSGGVLAPGLYELPDGARVADAVDAAGGFSEDGLVDSVNLARPVADGEQIVVGVRADQPEAAAGGGEASPAGTAAASGKVNLNTASAAELQALPGIGEATARKIVADRTANGAFRSVDDLARVSGIGEKKLAALADLVCV